MYSCVASCLRQNLFNHLLIQQLRIGSCWHWARHKCNPCVRNVSNVRGKWELIGQWRSRGAPVNYSSKFKQLSPNLEGMRKVILYELKKKKEGSGGATLAEQGSPSWGRDTWKLEVAWRSPPGREGVPVRVSHASRGPAWGTVQEWKGGWRGQRQWSWEEGGGDGAEMLQDTRSCRAFGGPHGEGLASWFS